ncbi:MAG: sugar ABC transporter permease [Chloroflexi bacterium]|nr:sugar ABC transporter permease [Chloroflexota bacterium]
MRVLPRTRPVPASVAAPPRRQFNWTPYLFILPYLIFFVAFRFGPSIAGLGIAFTNWSAIGTPEWIGWRNFEVFGRDPRFQAALENTIVFTAITVPLLIVLGLAFATFLDQKRRGRDIGRVAVFVPYVVMSTVVGVLWTWLLDKDFGLVNVYLGREIPWLVSQDVALYGIILATVWWNVGYNMVLFLAGLQDIPAELYEAARIDGANAWSQFTRVTLPLLAPTTFLVLLLTIINSFQVFDLVFVMTAGGPGTSTLTLVQYVYTVGFQTRNFGYASAVAVVLFIILIGLALIQTRLYRRGYSGVEA